MGFLNAIRTYLRMKPNLVRAVSLVEGRYMTVTDPHTRKADVWGIDDDGYFFARKRVEVGSMDYGNERVDIVYKMRNWEPVNSKTVPVVVKWALQR